jgi:predicted alpha/beta-fold hydrolase
VVLRNPSYDAQFVRTLAAAQVAGADLGEAIATARRLAKPDPTSWHEQWSTTADTARDDADAARAAGDRVSARHAYLRASEYHRQAYYFLRRTLDDPRLQASYAAHVDTFDAAVALMDVAAERVLIPYDGTAVVGYFFAPDDSGAPRPTLLFPCGYDSTAPSGYVQVPDALARGYNALVFEGPGQGEALYRQRLYFRPDYEHVLSQVVDSVASRKDVDAARRGLVGRSFAGYLAARGATAEHRVAALVCDPAQPDMGHRLPPPSVARVVGTVLGAATRLSADRAEFFGSRAAAHGATSVSAYFADLSRYTMLDRAAEIRCPTLLVESENDPVGGGAALLAPAMTAPTTVVELSAARGAGGHCAGLGQFLWAQAVYGWLDDVLLRAEAAPRPIPTAEPHRDRHRTSPPTMTGQPGQQQH